MINNLSVLNLSSVRATGIIDNQDRDRSFGQDVQ
jgi:hypothetical protein